MKTDSLGFLDAVIEKPVLELPQNWEIISHVGPRIVLRFWERPYGFRASVFDVSGRKVDEIRAPASAGTIIWGLSYPAGVYFIQVFEKPKTSTAKVVLVR